MLLCKYCKGYSHADCYGVMDINVVHVCGSCAIKENVDCTDADVKRFIEKPNKSQQDHSTFAFNLMLKRVMNSILKEEYKSTQPGQAADVEFMKIRFNMSSTYASKMVLHLIQNGYIVFFGGFQVDESRIKQFLYPSSTETLTIQDPEKVQETSSKTSGNKVLDEPRADVVAKESKNGGVGAKNSKLRKPILFSPSNDNEEEQEIAISDGSNSEIFDIKGSTKHTNEDNEGEPLDLGEGSSSNLNFTDSFSNSFTKKFIWPTRFMERESRKKNEPIEPIEIEAIGKNTKRAFFGQILETAGPRLNSSEKVGFNLVFTVGRNGESIQVWSFGEEKEINELAKLIVVDSYMVFWNYEIVPKISNKVPSTSDWAVKILPRSRNFDNVKVTRKYTDPAKSNGELIEKFSEKFTQHITQKPMPKKKEHSFKEKRKFKKDTSQQKMHRYLNIESDSLNISTSSFGSSQSKEYSPQSGESTPREEIRSRRKKVADSDIDSSFSPISTRSTKRRGISSSE